MARIAKDRILLIVGLTAGSARVCAQGWQHLGNVQAVDKRNDGVVLTAGTAKVQIAFFRPGIVRVRVAPPGTFPKDL
jgi:hypothetical protein